MGEIIYYADSSPYCSLQDFDSAIHPAPFAKGSHDILVATVEKLKRDYGQHAPLVKNQWDSSLALCPSSDISSEFISHNPDKFVIPLHQELFINSNVSNTFVQPKLLKKRNTNIPTMKSTGIVKWPNRGASLPFPMYSREYIDGSHDNPELITTGNCDGHEVGLEKLTIAKLKAKCKHLSISQSGKKSELVQRLVNYTNDKNIETNNRDKLKELGGFSKNKKVYLAVSPSHLKSISNKLEILCQCNPNEAKLQLLRWVTEIARLEFYIIADDTLYNVCIPNGTCAWQLVTVMKERGKLDIKHRDSSLRTGVIHYEDPEVKSKMIEQANKWKAMIDASSHYSQHLSVDMFHTRLNAYVAFLLNYDAKNERTHNLARRLCIGSI